jgi:lysophospholipase L1-like esterase
MISTQGLRDREYNYTKGQGIKRIAVLGDSFAFGWGVGNNQSFPKCLEEMLNSHPDGGGYEVLNFGVPGYNLEQELTLLKNKVLKFNPDYIIIYALSNDFEDTLSLGNGGLVKLLFRESFFFRQAILSTNLFLIKVGSAWPASNRFYYSRGMQKVLPELQPIAALLKARKVPFIFILHNIPEIDTKSVDKLQQFLEGNGLDFFLIGDYLDWSDKYDIEEDGHPNIKGHRAIAEAIFKALRENHLL